MTAELKRAPLTADELRVEVWVPDGYADHEDVIVCAGDMRRLVGALAKLAAGSPEVIEAMARSIAKQRGCPTNYPPPCHVCEKADGCMRR